MGEKRYAALDTDGNGVVSREEFAAAPERLQQARKNARLTRADRDGDGAIRPEEAQGMGRGGWRQGLREVDANGDGRWQVGEVEAALHARIEALDRNRDGVIGEDERRGRRVFGGRRG
jgi:hypothetical protein